MFQQGTFTKLSLVKYRAICKNNAPKLSRRCVSWPSRRMRILCGSAPSLKLLFSATMKDISGPSHSVMPRALLGVPLFSHQCGYRKRSTVRQGDVKNAFCLLQQGSVTWKSTHSQAFQCWSQCNKEWILAPQENFVQFAMQPQTLVWQDWWHSPINGSPEEHIWPFSVYWIH